MKIKIIEGLNEEYLEDKINDFIEYKNVIDIKYTMAPLDLDGSGVIEEFAHSALIIYKE